MASNGNKYSGIQKAEWALAGTNFASPVDLGDVASDSPGLKPDPKTSETGAGTALYAGTQNAFELNIFDISKYDALAALMKSDGKIDVRIVTMGETDPITVITNSGVLVSKSYKPKVGERNSFNLKCSSYGI